MNTLHSGGRLATLIVLFTALLMIPAAQASAQGLSTHQTTGSSTAVIVHMTTDCRYTSQSYAMRHHVCGYAKPGAQPDNIVGGTCGNSSLYIIDEQAGGLAEFDESAHSTLGPIVNVNYLVKWQNYTDNSTGSVGNFLSNYGDWNHQDYGNTTHTGYVTAVMSGYVILQSGQGCSFNYPSDGQTIT